MKRIFDQPLSEENFEIDSNMQGWEGNKVRKLVKIFEGNILSTKNVSFFKKVKSQVSPNHSKSFQQQKWSIKGIIGNKKLSFQNLKVQKGWLINFAKLFNDLSLVKDVKQII